MTIENIIQLTESERKRFRLLKGCLIMNDYELLVIVLMIMSLVVQMDNHK